MFFYNSHIGFVCHSDSFNSDKAIPLLTFDSFDDAKDFLLRQSSNFWQFHKSTFYYDSSCCRNPKNSATFKIRKFYGLNYYGIFCSAGATRFYLPFDYFHDFN